MCIDYEKGGNGHRHTPESLRQFADSHKPGQAEVEAMAACVKAP